MDPSHMSGLTFACFVGLSFFLSMMNLYVFAPPRGESEKQDRYLLAVFIALFWPITLPFSVPLFLIRLVKWASE